MSSLSESQLAENKIAEITSSDARPLPIHIRKATTNDRVVIAATWVESFKYSSLANQMSEVVGQDETGKPIYNRDLYFKYQRLRIDQTMQKAEAMVACFDEDQEIIFGYAVFERVPLKDDWILVLHYLYTKFKYRKQGIAHTIMDLLLALEPKIRYFTHRNDLKHDKWNLDWLKAKGFRYNPYLAR